MNNTIDKITTARDTKENKIFLDSKTHKDKIKIHDGKDQSPKRKADTEC